MSAESQITGVVKIMGKVPYLYWWVYRGRPKRRYES